MSVEAELIGTLDERIRDSDMKWRNIDMIAYRFGFRGHPCPTLKQVGQKYGLDNRQGAGQIINNHFRSIVRLGDLPSLMEVYELIVSRKYWLYADLSQKIAGSELAGDSFYVEGILQLLNEFGFSNLPGIFTPELKSKTSSSSVANSEGFVIDRAFVKEALPSFKNARRLPGRYGIARPDYLDDWSEANALQRSFLLDQMRHSGKCWTYEDGENPWYVFEDIAKNPLLNYSKKVFSLIDRCDVRILAETYHDALKKRSRPHQYPSVEILETYIKTSNHFDSIGNQVMFTGKSDRTKNPIERDLVEYLRGHRNSNFSDIKAYLSRLNYSSSNITQAVTHSPLVHINRDRGPRGHVYNSVAVAQISRRADRYDQVRRRLVGLGRTDESQEVQIRKEQAILREWLFKGRTRCSCAICGEEYPTTALVAAHKKKRTKCTEVERVDPFIVMPLCLFGCDFLYEERHVIVDEGTVKEGEAFDGGKEGSRYLNRILYRRLDEEWLKGSPSYFL